jgi:class 3 adenylate cyclase
VLILIAGGGMIAILLIAPIKARAFYSSGLILILLYGYIVLQLPFITGTVLAWTLIWLYYLTMFVTGLGRAPLFVSSIFQVSVSLIGMFAAYSLERALREDFLKERLLEAEREKSERLLLNVLPAPIAERLRDKPEAIADAFKDVTVLFVDLVAFTPLTQRIKAASMVKLLNHIFSLFDQLAEKHGVEKIKTIGDAYMVAAGVPEPRTDHTKAIAEMALDMLDVAEMVTMPDGEPLRIRIGMASGGPVVAGVIGTKKFIYDLWGDVVNTASRMESHGIPGAIQVSESTYRRLKAGYVFKERGVIDVKGKGPMRTYLLLGRRFQ